MGGPRNARNSLFELVGRGDIDVIRQAIVGTDIGSVRDRAGGTLLHKAVLTRNPEIVRLLVGAGLDLDLADSAGFTALHFAAQDYLTDIVDLLIRHGASVDRQDRHGNTPLQKAVFNSRGRGDVIRLLLAAGANPDLRNFHGKSPRELAQTIANYDVKQFLS